MESTVLIVDNSDVGVLVAVSAMEYCAVVVDVIVEHFYIKKNEANAFFHRIVQNRDEVKLYAVMILTRNFQRCISHC